MITCVPSPRPRMPSAICSRPTSVRGYSLAFRATSFMGRRAIIMLFFLTTSISTAFIVSSCVVDMAPTSVPIRLFNLLTPRTHHVWNPSPPSAKRVKFALTRWPYLRKSNSANGRDGWRALDRTC